MAMTERLRGIIVCFILIASVGFPIGFQSCGDAGFIQQKTVPSWMRTYGTAGTFELITASALTYDGAIVCGYTNAFGTNDVFVAKVDSFGIVYWGRVLKGVNTYGNDQATAVFPARDLGFIVVGQTNSFAATGFDIFVTYLESNGVTRWSQYYRGPGNDYAVSVQQDENANIFVAGYTNSGGAGADDALLMKLDFGGIVQWTKTYGGPLPDYASAIRVIPNVYGGGSVISGFSYNYGTNGDIIVMRLDNNGDPTWANSYGNIGLDRAFDIETATLTNNRYYYIVGGSSNSFDPSGRDQALIMYIDTVGQYIDSLSVATFGDNSTNCAAASLEQSGDHGFYATGTMGGQIFVMKLFANMNFNWERLYGSEMSVYLKIRNDGTVFVAGNSSLSNPDGRMLNLQYDGTSCSLGNGYTPPAALYPTSAMPVRGFSPMINQLSLTPVPAPFQNVVYNISVNSPCL